MRSDSDQVTTPELDTRAREAPAAAERSHPGIAETTLTWFALATGTVVVNIVILGIATAAGADMTVDLGFRTEVGWLAVVVATYGTLLVATFAWALVAHRVPAFAHLWVPLGWGVGLVSLGAITGVSDVGAGLALAAMHLLTTAVAVHLLPRRLPGSQLAVHAPRREPQDQPALLDHGVAELVGVVVGAGHRLVGAEQLVDDLVVRTARHRRQFRVGDHRDPGPHVVARDVQGRPGS